MFVLLIQNIKLNLLIEQTSKAIKNHQDHQGQKEFHPCVIQHNFLSLRNHYYNSYENSSYFLRVDFFGGGLIATDFFLALRNF